jgi:hypothetical protein
MDARGLSEKLTSFRERALGGKRRPAVVLGAAVLLTAAAWG